MWIWRRLFLLDSPRRHHSIAQYDAVYGYALFYFLRRDESRGERGYPQSSPLVSFFKTSPSVVLVFFPLPLSTLYRVTRTPDEAEQGQRERILSLLSSSHRWIILLVLAWDLDCSPTPPLPPLTCFSAGGEKKKKWGIQRFTTESNKIKRI